MRFSSTIAFRTGKSRSRRGKGTDAYSCTDGLQWPQKGKKYEAVESGHHAFIKPRYLDTREGEGGKQVRRMDDPFQASETEEGDELPDRECHEAHDCTEETKQHRKGHEHCDERVCNRCNELKRSKQHRN